MSVTLARQNIQQGTFEETGKEPVLEHLIRGKCNCLVHMLRSSDDIMAKQVPQWTPQSCRGRE